MSTGSASAAEVEDLLPTAAGRGKDSKDSGASDGGAAAAASRGGQPASGQAEVGAGGGHPPKPVADLRIAKNTMTRKIKQQEYGKKEAAMMKNINACAEDLSSNANRSGSEEFKVLLDRMDLMLAFFGKQRVVDKSAAGVGDVKSWVDVQAAWAP
eukprot:4392651-Pyramimonas_sp.AAC.1